MTEHMNKEKKDKIKSQTGHRFAKTFFSNPNTLGTFN